MKIGKDNALPHSGKLVFAVMGGCVFPCFLRAMRESEGIASPQASLENFKGDILPLKLDDPLFQIFTEADEAMAEMLVAVRKLEEERNEAKE